MSFNNPFASSTAKAGHGSIMLSLLPPSTPVLQTLSYQYPLKLVAPDPLPPPSYHDTNTQYEENGYKPLNPSMVHTVFLLTYGGGIVAGDEINLSISLAPHTRLILLTQGSTKIFKTPSPTLISRQRMTTTLAPHCALVYLPDPVQPFADSTFEQSQIYNLQEADNGVRGGSLCVCDWVTSGRSARDENWSFYSYRSRNEVWLKPDSAAGKRRLLLRDNLILDKTKGYTGLPIASRMDALSVFGTLILYGPIFASLVDYFLAEFEALPRIGGRQWNDSPPAAEPSAQEVKRAGRQEREKKDGVIWSAASVRGFVLVKFAAREVEGARNWLRYMLRDEATLMHEFGERSLLCLK